MTFLNFLLEVEVKVVLCNRLVEDIYLVGKKIVLDRKIEVCFVRKARILLIGIRLSLPYKWDTMYPAWIM